MNQQIILLFLLLVFFISFYDVSAVSLSVAQNSSNRNISAGRTYDDAEEPDEITRYRIQACADCEEYKQNHCSTVSGAAVGIGCPEDGEEACQICAELHRIKHLNPELDDQSHEGHKLVKRACLPYGADCSSGYCCRNLGLKCVTNSEGRGRNHNFCRAYGGL